MIRRSLILLIITNSLWKIYLLTAPRPECEGRGFPLQRTEPKPRATVQDYTASPAALIFVYENLSGR